MYQVNIISKSSHTELDSGVKAEYELKENAVVLVNCSVKELSKIEKNGNDLILYFQDGSILTIHDYYNSDNTLDNSLVFKEDDGKLLWIQHLDDIQALDQKIYYQVIDEVDPLLYHDSAMAIGLPWLIGAGVAGVAGVAAAVNSGNDSNYSTDSNKPSNVVPNVPTVTENNATGLSGTAEAGSIITVTDALGHTVTTIADSAGHWSISPNPLTDGTEGVVTATNAAGNSSAEISTGIADTIAPNTPNVTENNAAGLAGTAEAGSIITVTDALGHTVTTTADSTGHWSITPNPIADGTEGTVTATDAVGNVSIPVSTGTADLTAPNAPTVDTNNVAGLSGTAEAGSTVTVTDASGNTVTTIADSTGHWSISPNPLEDGTKGIVTATDEAGNTSTPVSTGVLDQTVPDQTSPNGPVVTENNATGLAGTAEAGSTVTVTDASGKTVTTTADSAGHWSITPNPIADGTEGTVTATDAAGNVSTPVSTGLADLTAPDAPVVDENNTAGLSGTAEAGSTVTVTDASGKTVTTTADSAGHWSINPNPIAEGTQGTVTATDAAGNISVLVSTGTADLTAPDAPVVDENNSAGLTGTAEAGSTVTITNASGNTVTTIADSTGHWSISPNPIADGTQGTVTATDAAGNISAPVSTGLADLTAPDAPVVDENNAAGLSGTAEAGSTVTVTDASGNTVTATADSAGHWSITPNPIADGTEGTVTATDAAGNESAPVSTGLADLTAPDAPVVDENNSAGLAGTAEAGSTVTVTDASGHTVTTTADSAGQWSITPNPIAEGTQGTVTATDAAGNESSPVSTDLADLTAPNAPVVTENNAAGLAGTAEAGSTVTVTDTSGKTVTTVADSVGNWSITPNPITNGTEGIVTATDAAGNISNETPTGIAQKTAPDAPVVDENNSAGLAGTAEAGSTVTVTDASGNTVTATADSTGHWSITPNPIAEGTAGTVTATDAAGNVSAPVSTGLADLTAPNVPVVDENNSAGLAGTAEAGSTVTVTDALGNTVTATADSTGHWSITPNPIAEGTAGTVTATDAAGNISAPVSTGLADLTAPNAPVVDENNSSGLSGTAEAGSTVTVTDALGNTVTTVADSAGQWSITPNPITDGTEGTVTATDAAGNISNEIPTGIAQKIAPDAPVVDENNAAGLSGTAEAGSTVTVTDASGHTVTTVADSAGYWSITPNPIADGTEGTVTATDAAGNVSAPVSTGTADLTAPDAPVVTENNSAGLAGTAEAGSTVTVTDASGKTVTTTADSAGHWSITPNPIANGTEGTVTATDTAGNESTPISTGTADLTAPVVTENNAAGLAGTAEAGSTVTVTDASGNTVTATTDSAGHWSITPNPIADGTEGTVTATDAAGNTSTETPTGIAQKTAPDAPVVDENNAAGLVGTAEAGSTVTVTDASGNTVTAIADSAGQWSITPNPIAEGTEGTVTATDAAGNVSTPVSTGTADLTAPDAPVVDENNSAGLAGTADAGSTVTVTDASGNTVTAIADSAGQWSITPNPIADGTEGTVTATDAAGNVSTPVSTGLADLTAPDAPVVDENNAAGLAGTAEAGSTVTVTDALGNTVTAIADSAGNWSISPNPIADGTKGTVTATDAAGNESAPVSTGTADLTAPDAPVVDENNSAGLAGTAEAGSTVTVSDALGHTVTTVADSNGQWNIIPNPIANGTEGTVTATDAAGNRSNETFTGIAQKTAPDAPVVDENNAAGLAGTAEAGSIVTVTDALGNTVTAIADSTGQWSITPNPIADGTEGTVTATDAAGNVSAPVSTGLADFTAPDAPIVDENNSSGLSGTAEAGSTVTVTDALGHTVTTTADSAGQWRITPNPIANGTEGTVTATDTAGNVSAPASTGLADLTAPNAPVVDENNSAGLAGTAEAGSTVTVTDASGHTVTTTADSAGQWRITPNPIANGTEGTVTATDAAGNISNETSTGIAQKTAPDAPVVDENNAAGLAGTTEAGSTVTVTDASGNTVTAIADSAGHWSISPNPIADGTEGIVTATDAAGNESAPVSTGLADLTAPDAPVVDENNSAGLAGTAEAGSIVTVTDASGNTVTAIADSAGQWSITPNPIADGTEGTVTATDAAGNVSAPVSIGLADLTAPDAPVVDENNAAGLAGTAEAGSIVTVTDASGNTVTAIADSAGHWLITPNPIANGTEGTVTATDAAGNTSTETPTGIAQKTAPDAPVVDENNAAGLAGTAEAGSTVTVTDASGNTVTATANSAGNWTITPNPIAEGTQGTVTATDAAGNVSTPVSTGTADFTAPNAPVVDENNSAGLAGTAEAGSTVTVSDALGHTVTTVADSNGQWNIIPNPITNGTEGTVTATDAAGNTSTETPTGIAQKTAPDAPVVDENNAAGLNGTAEAGSTVTVTDASGHTVTTVADSTGQWSIIPNPIADGTAGTVTATDAAGNESTPVSTGLSDLTAPDAPVVDENNSAGLAGTAEAGSTVTVTDALGNTVTAIVDSAGNWSISPNPIADGTAGTVTATDAAGNVSAPASIGLADLTAPDAPVVDENNSAGLAGTAEAGSTVTVTDALGNTVTTTADSAGQWSITPNPIADGTEGTVTATDAAGNVSTPVSTGLADFTAPNAPVVDENNSSGLSGTAEAGSTVTVTDALGNTVTAIADSAGNWSITPNPIADGTEGTVTATDEAGNSSDPISTGTAHTAIPAQPEQIIEYLDDVGLVTGIIAIAKPTDDSKPCFEIKVLGTDETATLYIDGKAVDAVYDAKTGTLTPVNDIAEGTHTVSYTITDAYGNESEPSIASNFTVDITAPEQTVVISSVYDDQLPAIGTVENGGFTNDTSPELIGTISQVLNDGDVVSIYRDGVKVGEAIVDGFNWTYIDTSGLVTGDYTYTACVEDSAGNSGEFSESYIIHELLTTPTTTIAITGYYDDVGEEQGLITTPNSTTDDRAPVLEGTINGTLAVGEQIAIVDKTTGKTLGYATVDTDTNTWSFDLSSLQNSTTYKYVAYVEDVAGNRGTVSNELDFTVSLGIYVNGQSTIDTTPIITGYVGFDIDPGEYIEVTVNGVTYSSRDGDVVVDPQNNTWYVQIPDVNALGLGKTDVKAVLRTLEGNIVTEDASTNEISIAAIPTVDIGAGSGDTNQKATAVTINTDGTWLIHSNQSMWTSKASDSTNLGEFNIIKILSNSGAGYTGSNYVQNATFIDYNRDGLMDLFTVDSSYQDGQQMFYNKNGGWVPYQVGAYTYAPQTGDFAGDTGTGGSANTWSWYGGIIAIDKDGDGYVDMIIGDQTPNDTGTQGGYGSQIVLNHDGTVTGMDKDGNFALAYGTDSAHRPIGQSQSQTDMELSGVDINNDGIVDFVMHCTNVVANDESFVNSTGAQSNNENRLVVVNGTDNGTWEVTQIVENVFQRNDTDPGIGNGVAMTWADFNGDGYLDLFLARGNESTTTASGVANSNAEYQSRIYFNDGTGKLLFADPNNDGIGNPTGLYNFGDTLAGGSSLAVDWNHDGKIDIIELPGMPGNTGGITAAASTGPINLYINTTTGSSVSFVTSNLLLMVGKTTIGSSSDPVTGAISIDLDFDGAKDLLVFTSQGHTQYIANTNKVEDGTSLHARMLDKNGINIFYGNTVQLIDESTGKVISTQIINPQSGNQTNDSTALVDFYGLDASKTYTIKLLSGELGYSWTGISPGASNTCYVFTAEGANQINNASDQGGATNTIGIVGTGYNDTFYATQGTDIYNGAGGSTNISGVKYWSNTGGMDIVDYKYANTTAITVDLSNTAYQNTGFGTAKFVNIEGISGASGNDVFTNSGLDNYFEGRGGNDTFNLTNHGGHDTLIYKLLDSTDATGGNGVDVVNGFFVGTYEATADADRIDINSLLNGYTASGSDGYAAKYINGVATINTGDDISNYLNVYFDGTNTHVQIDKNGTGNYSDLLVMNNVHTDLATLLANHQIIIG